VAAGEPHRRRRRHLDARHGRHEVEHALLPDG
jgi:hypothetical protein